MEEIVLCAEVASGKAICDYGYDCDGCPYNPDLEIIRDLYPEE